MACSETDHLFPRHCQPSEGESNLNPSWKNSIKQKPAKTWKTWQLLLNTDLRPNSDEMLHLFTRNSFWILAFIAHHLNHCRSVGGTTGKLLGIAVSLCSVGRLYLLANLFLWLSNNPPLPHLTLWAQPRGLLGTHMGWPWWLLHPPSWQYHRKALAHWNRALGMVRNLDGDGEGEHTFCFTESAYLLLSVRKIHGGTSRNPLPRDS